MNKKDLQTFLKIAETGSITAAAAALDRSQPSVTRCLQDLEAQLGFSLFERTGRRISPTSEGIAFEEEARRLIAIFEELPARTRERARSSTQPMSISATYALGTGLVPHALACWREPIRPSEIRLTQTSPSAVAQDMLSGSATVGLASLPLDVNGLCCHRSFSAPLVLALPEKRALEFPENQPVSLVDLDGETVATMLDQTRLQGRIRHAMDNAGICPLKTMHANSSLSALQFSRLNGAAAIVDPVTAFGVALPGIVLRPLSEHIEFSFGFFTNDSTNTSQETSTFFDLCEKALFLLVPHARQVDKSKSKAIED